MSAIVGLPPGEARRIAEIAVTEDLAGGVDITTAATISEQSVGVADLVARAGGVVCGLPIAAAVFELCCGDEVRITTTVSDGDVVEAGAVVMTVAARTRAVLTAERSALNVLGRLSGIATLTARWVSAVAGTGAEIRDTRKTTPGLRVAEKYAVRCGGGRNHRMNLTDQALIKDNHLVAAGGVASALAAVRALAPDVFCEVECDTVEQVEQAGVAGAELVLLDNMPPAQLREAVEVARRFGMRTEASGGLTLAVAAEVAATGVDYLAVGALTHSAPTLDISLDLRPS
jgi:nicotinate-nucleotide pyrophosphorylase (carboxylating)